MCEGHIYMGEAIYRCVRVIYIWVRRLVNIPRRLAAAELNIFCPSCFRFPAPALNDSLLAPFFRCSAARCCSSSSLSALINLASFEIS